MTERGGGGGGGGGVTGAGGESKLAGDTGSYLQEATMRKMVSSVRGASYRPTLPPEIVTDAAIYVAVSSRARKGKEGQGRARKGKECMKG